MKRSGTLLAYASLTLVLLGVTLSLLSGRPESVINTTARIMMAASVLLFIAAALVKPKYAHAENGGGRISGLNPEKTVPVCGFCDVAANKEALESLQGLVDYLKNPEKYARYGARMPHGVLLYGPPGTGKTLLARALAGEAGVPFFALSGSDFVQLYVGVGASRVRELFQNARKSGKCVIFIDEIDAMGKKRDQQSSDERDQTLNALLSEMSGFRTSDGVIVLAATNRLDSLDPALLRPGRFDRQIEVGLPGKEERLSILKLHSKNKPIAQDVDFESLAQDTCLFSGASLENLLNEAAINAAMRNSELIGGDDIREAFFKTVAGAEKPSAATQAERATIALHEAGHAVVSRLLLPENRLARITILPAGHGTAGYNLSIPAEKTMLSKRDIEKQIQVLLAGRAAELLLNGEEEMTAGASNDLSRAADLASALVLDLGMAGEPAVALRALSRACGGGTNALDKCRAKLEELYQNASALLAEHVRPLVSLTEALLEKETLCGDDVDKILAA